MMTHDNELPGQQEKLPNLKGKDMMTHDNELPGQGFSTSTWNHGQCNGGKIISG